MQMFNSNFFNQLKSFRQTSSRLVSVKQKRGVVLLMVLAVLTVLTILGVIFASLSKVERTVARNYVDSTRARFLAQSGVEMGLINIPDLESMQNELPPYLYGLEFTDSNSNGRFDPGTNDAIKKIKPKVPSADTTRYPSFVPLEEMRYPSLKGWGQAININNAELVVEDVNHDKIPDTIGYTTRLPSAYPGGVNTYSLKIRDCASMIYINGPGVSADDWSLAPNAVNMLNNLGNIWSIKINKFGEILSNARAKLGRNFFNREEVKEALLKKGYTEKAYNRVKDFITCHAWVDQKTFLPGALRPFHSDNIRNKRSQLLPAEPRPGKTSVLLASHQPILPGGFLTGGTPYCFSFKIPFYPCCGDDPINTFQHIGSAKFEDTNWKSDTAPPITPKLCDEALPSTSDSTPAPLLQPRAPININTAPKEVLRAVLTKIQSYHLKRDLKNDTRPGKRVWGTSNTGPISPAIAGKIADEIIKRRGDKNKGQFRSWSDFNKFIDELNVGLTNYKKAAIKVNANPNSRLTKFNPNKAFGARYGDTDKSDLGDWVPGGSGDCGWTTEFCFSSMGYYEIESLGRVWGPVTKKAAINYWPEARSALLLKFMMFCAIPPRKIFSKLKMVNMSRNHWD